MEHPPENQQPLSHPTHPETPSPDPYQEVQVPDPRTGMAIAGFGFGLGSLFAWGVMFLPGLLPQYYTPIASFFPYIHLGTMFVLIGLAFIFSRLGLKSSRWKELAISGLLLSALSFHLLVIIGCLVIFNVDL